MYGESNDFGVGYAVGRDSSNNNGFGGDGSWIWLIALFALFGWGGNGFGGFGGGFGGGCATRNDLCESFNFNNLDNAVRGVQNGLSDGFYAVNTTLLNGFNGTERSICNLGYNLQNCCCETQRAIDGVNYNLAQSTCALQNTLNANTRDIIQSQQCGTQRILDYLSSEKISNLQAENALLTSQLSQNSQTSNIINTLTDRLRPTPVPAFPASNLYGYWGNWNNGGYNNGCGCGC